MISPSSDIETIDHQIPWCTITFFFSLVGIISKLITIYLLELVINLTS